VRVCELEKSRFVWDLINLNEEKVERKYLNLLKIMFNLFAQTKEGRKERKMNIYSKFQLKIIIFFFSYCRLYPNGFTRVLPWHIIIRVWETNSTNGEECYIIICKLSVCRWICISVRTWEYFPCILSLCTCWDFGEWWFWVLPNKMEVRRLFGCGF